MFIKLSFYINEALKFLWM